MKLIKIFYFLLGFIFLDFCLSRTSLPINKYRYTMGYKKIYKKIKDTKGQKRIILFGGSSLAWGLSAKDLTNDLRILTLNSGIHGAMGTKRILSTVIDVIEKDKDLIVISPEYQSINQNFAKSRSKEYCEIILYTLNKYPTECIGYSLNKVIRLFPTFNKKSGDYFKSGFNEYGDYVYRRQQVNMIGKVRKDKNCIKNRLIDSSSGPSGVPKLTMMRAQLSLGFIFACFSHTIIDHFQNRPYHVLLALLEGLCGRGSAQRRANQNQQ